MTLADICKIPFDEENRPKWLQALDPGAHYYRLLYEITRRYAPKFVVEIGTGLGRSAAHLAEGNRSVDVITIDNADYAMPAVNSFNLPNVYSIQTDSLDFVTSYKIDLLFIDGEHSSRAGREFDAYRRFLAPHSIVLFDDIRLTPDMEKVWAQITEPKVELNEWHHSGFGAVYIER